VFGLLVSEAGLLAAAGVAVGFVLTYAGLAVAAPLVEDAFGIVVRLRPPGLFDAAVAGGVVAAALVMGTLPAWRAYRNALADGLTIRI
jgi:putative ABC transport system permease protein